MQTLLTQLRKGLLIRLAWLKTQKIHRVFIRFTKLFFAAFVVGVISLERANVVLGFYMFLTIVVLYLVWGYFGYNKFRSRDQNEQE